MKLFLLCLALLVPLEAMAAERVESPWPGGVWLEDGKYYPPNSFTVSYTSDQQLVSTSVQQCVNGKCSMVQTVQAVPVTASVPAKVQLSNFCPNGQCGTTSYTSPPTYYNQPQSSCGMQKSCSISFGGCGLFKKCFSGFCCH